MSNTTIKQTTRLYICPVCSQHITTISFNNVQGIDKNDQVVVNMLVNAHINLKHNDNTIVMQIEDEHIMINKQSVSSYD